MLRSRVLAAATATLLALGMSVGGAGAAVAVIPAPVDIDTGAIAPSSAVTQPTWENCVERPAIAEIPETTRVEYQRYSWTGRNSDPQPTDIPPSANWQANTTNYAGAGGGTDPINTAFFVANGNSDNGSWFYWTAKTVVDQPYVPASPAVTCDYEVGLYLYKKLNPGAAASWPNSGPQRFIAEKEGTEWFPFSAFPVTLPADVCGPGWAVQQDKVRVTGDFTWPESISYPNDNIGWPPIYAAQHHDLERYIAVPPCDTTEIQECETPNPVTELGTLDGMYFETRSGGSQVLGNNGIEIATFGDDLTQAKSAGYVILTSPIPYGEIGSPAMDYETISGASAGLNVTIYKDGAWFGNLVYEPLFSEWWINKVVPGMPAGPNPGYQLAYGSLDDFFDAFVAAGWVVDARAIGYSLGSGAIGEGVVRSLSIGCDQFVFGPPTLPAINVVGSSVDFTCERPSGSFTVGLGVDGQNGDKLVWSTTAPGSATLPGTVVVTTPGIITVTVDVADEFSGYGLNVEGVTGGTSAVDPVTGAVTFTFEFNAVDDCPVVVPEITYIDECITELELDAATASAPLTAALMPVSNFTVTASPNVSYSYTVNGGEPVNIVFPDGEDTVTVPVPPGSTVVVTVTAPNGYVVPEGDETWSHEFSISGGCIDLPPLPNWPASVSDADQVCTPSGSLVSGSITVVFPVGSEENPNPVRYYLAFGTPQQVELTSATTAVAPGTYVVTAQAFLPTDSVNNSGRTVTFEPLTVGASNDVTCTELDTLAFTGTSEITSWLGVLAVLLTVAGMGFVLRRHRVEV
jgi:hypothetical protein